MTDIWYDTEFHERGAGFPIDFVSIGMVREDGAELYLINLDTNLDALAEHPWLRANVLPHLPAAPRGGELVGTWWDWDEGRPDYRYVQPLAEIRDQVRRFVLDVERPRLWAWYGAYDHVVLAQLFGRMVDLPTGFPMWTNDIRQVAEDEGNPPMPHQAAGLHKAIDDARWNRLAHGWLRSAEGTRGVPLR